MPFCYHLCLSCFGILIKSFPPPQTVTYFTSVHTNFFCLCICLSCVHTVWNGHGLCSQVRMCYGFFWVETDWKETLPWRQLSKRPTAKMYKRTKSVFVQVFHIGLVPDIFLNGTKWRTIFGITAFSSPMGPVRFHRLQTPALFLRNSSTGPTVPHLCFYINMHSSLSCLFLPRHHQCINTWHL